jgi:putative flippase GtrA
LVELGNVNYIAAFVLAFLVGNAMGYLLNGRYTFALAKKRDRAAVARYFIVNCMLLAANTLALRMLVEHIGVGYVFATVLLATGNVPASFVAHRSLTFGIGRPVAAPVLQD